MKYIIFLFMILSLSACVGAEDSHDIQKPTPILRESNDVIIPEGKIHTISGSTSVTPVR